MIIFKKHLKSEKTGKTIKKLANSRKIRNGKKIIKLINQIDKKK
jgi:hypothetical protein